MKKIISYVLLFALIFTFSPSYASAAAALYEKKAEVLSVLNILKGDEDGFRLESSPTRLEAVIIMLRLTGNESAAVEKNLHHPFTDVPDWAGAYAGYAFASGITSGVSETRFGTDEELTANQFITFVLRALGYNDLNGDFDVDGALEFARSKKIITSDVDADNFKRKDIVSVLYDVLGANVNNSDLTFAKRLKALDVFTDEDEIKATKIIADFVS